jgi:hypothetical protein
MDDDMTDNVDKMCLIIDVSCVDWMIRWIGCMLKKLHNRCKISCLQFIVSKIRPTSSFEKVTKKWVQL